MTPEALAETHLAAFGEEKSWPAETFAKFLKDPAVMITGESDGFVLGRVTVDEAEILTVATAPNRRRQGLAASALEAFMKQVRLAGATSVFLEVAEDNFAAIGLYEREGFLIVGERKDYYRQKNAAPITALILRRDLP